MMGMDLKEMLKRIARDPGLLNRLSDVPNIPMRTMGGTLFWDNLARYDGWRIQQNTFTGHCRILDPGDVRRAWGSMSDMERICRQLAKTSNIGELKEAETRKILALVRKEFLEFLQAQPRIGVIPSGDPASRYETLLNRAEDIATGRFEEKDVVSLTESKKLCGTRYREDLANQIADSSLRSVLQALESDASWKALLGKKRPTTAESRVLNRYLTSLCTPGGSPVSSAPQVFMLNSSLNHYLTSLCTPGGSPVSSAPQVLMLNISDRRLNALQRFVPLFDALESAKNLGRDGIPQVLRRFADGRAEAGALVEQYRQMTAVSGETLPRVTVCGLLKAGKSTLLNMLTEHFDAEYFATGVTRKTISVETYDHNGIRYADTPGLDAPNEDEQRSWQAFVSTDVLLFAHALTGELNAMELDILARFRQARPDCASSMVVALTNADELRGDSEKIDRMKRVIGQQLQRVLSVMPPLFVVSSTSYGKGKRENRNALIESGNVQPLLRHLEDRRERLASSIQDTRKKAALEVKDRLTAVIRAEYDGAREDVSAAEEAEREDNEAILRRFSTLTEFWREPLRNLDNMA
jgi:GTP-binding protein EngB required for normal cell division